MMEQPSRLGFSGRIAGYFLSARITPLLALIALLLGLFAMLVTPREEEPQINVTMANVLIPFPGAQVADVEQMVTTPAEQVLSQIAGIEHITSQSRPGLAIITLQFKVGVPRTEALVKLYDTIHSNADWLPSGLGVLPPLIKPKGIDDVPIVALTLFSRNPDTGADALTRVAHSIEADLKRVPGTREVRTIGGPRIGVRILLDPARLNASGLSVGDLRNVLTSANNGMPVGDLLHGNKAVHLDAGTFLQNARDIGSLVVAVRKGAPVLLQDVATIVDGAFPPEHYVWYGTTGTEAGEYPAVTLAITKKPGTNAVEVADAVLARVSELRNTLIPAEVQTRVTRDYGVTANDKAMKLIEKLLFATLSVVALVFLALGKRESLIVGSAVILTLTATLFASWAWGFTLNRVSLFALIFSIGILVDDAIVVVENIHRHRVLHPDRTLAQLIPHAVDEVGGPTILATLTVIAALLPMAFVSGLMGPYMSPIPINASMGMIISLAIAFIVTPWLAHLWLDSHHAATAGTGKLTGLFDHLAHRLFPPFLDSRNSPRNRTLLWIGIIILIGLSVLLPVGRLVILKMLPFDNKSEFQIVVDMPADSPLENTAAVLHEMGRYLATVPEVTDYQAYAGTSAPINFNGLVRQYYLRTSRELGDIQVNLTGKHQRSEQSHTIAMRIRPALTRIGAHYGARVKIVEVPPGPPVLAPIVAEIYGPDQEGRRSLAARITKIFRHTPNIVDVDESTPDSGPRRILQVDRHKAALLGVSQTAIAMTLMAGMTGEDATFLHDAAKYPHPVRLILPPSSQGSLDTLLTLGVHTSEGRMVPLGELVHVLESDTEKPVYHKDLLPVEYVMGDMAGHTDSPLYGMFAMRPAILDLATPGGHPEEYFIRQLTDPYRSYAIKWDGEWQITYETFRDMGIAYAVGLILIYLLVVAQFGSYLTPLIIMAPIPLTIVGVMPGHALLGAQFTATSMIGMIALAGIIVRNSILLVDFINQQAESGVPFREAIIHSAATRAQPIILTGLAAMIGALFILDDPIFNGLAISLIFGILVSTLLTLIVIPLLYYVTYHTRYRAIAPSPENGDTPS